MTVVRFGPPTCRRPIQLPLLVGVAALALVSCSGGKTRKPVYPVHGQVFVGGRAATHAFLVLHPVDDSTTDAVRPYGHVAADGSFKLSTYDPGDGAPAGEYAVTVVWLATAGPNEDAPDRLKGRYRDAKTTKLRATIQKGPTELEPFQLTP